MQTKNLCKVFAGKEVIHNCTMSVERGTIYGFLGKNGAGKTTVFKILLGLLKPTMGKVSVLGMDSSKNNLEVLRRTGSLIETPIFYEHLSAMDNLQLHLDYMEINGGEIAETLKMVGLSNVGTQAVSTFSLGMRQRLAIARAIVHKPELLILDEPVNSLDPVGIKEMRELFCELVKQQNITILLSSHILSAFESPTVQACVPQMQSSDNIIKGNAVVNQVAAVAALIAPILGSVLYTAFGLKPVLYAGVLCFFVTAAFECFIKLEYIPIDNSKGLLSIIKSDFLTSMRFIGKEQSCILKMLLLSTLVSFFVMGTAIVGLPYIVRNVLSLNAEYYGFAESALGLAAIIGSIAAGLLTEKMKPGKLSIVVVVLGVFLFPAGIIFLLPTTAITRYIVNIISFCGMQIAACIFSIFALSMIQQRTPNHLTGKVMAYVATISMCAQPLGQMVYGILFDKFSNAVFLVLLPTGIFVCMIGLLAINFFKSLEN